MASGSPCSPVKTVTQNEFEQQAIRLWRQAYAYPKIAFPLGAEVEIEDREQEVLLLAERVHGGNRSDPTIVFEASTDLGRESVADFGVGGKRKALVRGFSLQTPLKHRIQCSVPGTLLLIDNRPNLEGPGIRGERTLLIADLGRQTEAHGDMPALRGANTRTDMVPHPLPASLRLDTGKEVEAGLEPRREAVRDFDRLVGGVLRGQYAVFCLRRPLDGGVAMKLEHRLPRFKRLGAIHLNLKVTLGADGAGPPAHGEEYGPAPHPLLERHRGFLP